MSDQELLQELREVLHDFRTLQEHKGWQRLVRYAAAQREGRVNDLLLKVDTKTKEVHFLRGELAGIKLFCEIPAIEVERIQADIEKLVKKVEETDNVDEELDDFAP